MHAENNTTNIISGLATNAGAVYFVGQSGSSNALEIRSNGGLTNGMGFIGYTVSASNNSALVSGTGSRWINTTNLYVGFTGPANRLTITNGALVQSDFAYIASDNNSANNMVLITGSGSKWESANDFILGYDGPGNRLILTNGGQIRCHSDSLLGGFFDTGSDNAAWVTGSGSIWTSAGNQYVGYASEGNQLLLTNGGRMTNQSAYIGELGSSSNTVLVTGANSIWNCIGGALTVGDQAFGGQASTHNQLVVTNGAAVYSLGGYVGNDDTANDNQVLVTGAGTRWTNAGDFYAGASGSFNQLSIQNGGQLSNTNAYIGWDGVAASNTVLVNGGSARWNNNGDVYAGYYGSFNQLTIQNGAQVSDTRAYLGFNDGADFNLASVSGVGSRWSNRADLFVGNGGSANALTILGAAQVASINGYLGALDSSDSNLVIVADEGSVWTNSASLEIGFNGTANSLVISNGGKVFCSFGRLGAYGSAGSALVTGPNAQWLDSGDLYIGQTGPDNALQIDAGGLVTNVAAYAGLFTSNTTILVSGTGSRWKSGGELILGYDGPCNSLMIQDGGLVSAASVVVGALSDSTNNLLSISTASLTATNSGAMAQIEVRNGILALTNGIIHTTNLFVSANGALTGVGTITAAAVTNAGLIAPGYPTGCMAVNGNLRLSTNSLMSFELGGYTPGVTYDCVSVGNSASLGGALAVSFVNGFEKTITNGATFLLITANLVSGAFTNAEAGLRLMSTDGLADFIVTYSGTSVVLSQARALPRLAADPASLNFGPVAAGSSATQAFHVANLGGLALTGTVTTAAPFAIASTGSLNLNPGQTGQVLISFSPASAGAFSNVVLFLSNGGNATNSVLGSAAPPPSLSVTPPAHDFGVVPLGMSANFAFLVANSGASPLTCTASVTQGPFVIMSAATFSLGSLASTNLIIQFTPTNIGSFSGNLVIASDAGSSTNPLSGLGTDAPMALSIQISGSDVLIWVTTISGRNYQLERAELVSGSWSPVGNHVLGTGAIIQLIDPGGAGQQKRFYRVSESP